MTIHQTTIRPPVTPAEQRFLDLYASVAERLPGARLPSVRAWRERALDRFVAHGMPHRRIEEWKYTDLRMLMPEVRPLAGLSRANSAKLDLNATIGTQLAQLDAYRAVFVDGIFRADLSTVHEAKGLSFGSVRAAFEKDDGAAKTLAKLPAAERDAIAALATAFATDGAVLSILPDATIGKPVHLIFVSTGSPQLTATAHAIHIGEGAAVSLIETHAAPDDAQCISFTHLEIGASASVSHVRTNAGGKHLASATVLLGERTRYDPVQMTVDGALTRAETRIRFGGREARCHYAGAMMLRGQSHADFTLVVEHAAEACESRELVKAVVDGRSRGVFQGKVVVERGAQKTDGKQMANALLLSDEAEFDSKPELEIFADDVVCGHGATAGQLDDGLMFYLRTRGIPEIEARALLIAAFVGEALEKIENEALRSALEEKAHAWLSK